MPPRPPPLRASRGALLASLALSTAACSNDDEQRSPEDRYPEVYSEAVCAVMGPCCEANGLTFDQDGCTLGGTAFGSLGVKAAQEADATFDAETADACIAATVRLARSCLPAGSDPAASLSCSSIWTGGTPPGGTCADGLDCASTATGRGACVFYTDAEGTKRGACTVKTQPAAVGDVCGTPDGAPPEEIADCAASGLQCDVLTQRCKVLIPLGGACVGFDGCEDGAYCDATDTCAARKLAGETCAENAECAVGLCLRGECAENAVGALTICTGEEE